MQVHTALDCCKDFRNLRTSKLNEIEEKGKHTLLKIFVAVINKLFVSHFVKFAAK